MHSNLQPRIEYKNNNPHTNGQKISTVEVDYLAMTEKSRFNCSHMQGYTFKMFINTKAE